jgi:hypothetical protein
MNRRTLLLLAPFALLTGCNRDTATPVGPVVDAQAQFSKTAQGGRAASVGVVYVSSQGLYYDTFVSASVLPQKGRFQRLVPDPNGGPSVTEFGPGEPGYLGGRWWVDANANNIHDEGDAYLLCPLLPPGRATP